MGVRRVKGLKKEKEEKKKEAVKEKKFKKKVIEGVRGIVRVAEVDLDGNKKLRNSLLGVKGIGKSLAKAIPIAAGLSSEALLGSLNDEQIKKLEDVMKNPLKYGIPRHMINRRLDPLTGEDKHLVSSQLRFSIKSDIDFMRKIRSYKGIRHESGLPVRGQRTRTSFRGGRTVGVAKKRELRKAARKEAPKATGAKTTEVEATPSKPEKKESK
jgi:small subunit ribosomal protein S13